MTTYSETPRFLAGAICPKCEAMDRIRVFSKEGKDFRECVSCGFLDELHFSTGARELDTRVNKSQMPEADEQIVNLVELTKKRS